jgi:ketosteroid isomerase-like protein
MRRLACLLIAAAGCAHVNSEGARRSLLQADIQFDQAVAQRGVEAWVETFAEDGVMFPRNEPLLRGREKIGAEMAALGDPRKGSADLKIRWKPLHAEVSPDGTLGWTYGNAHIVSKQGEQRAKYVTVWRRAPDGSWKVVADIGTAGDAEPGAGPD